MIASSLRLSRLVLVVALAGCAGQPIDIGSRIPEGTPLHLERDIRSQACGFQLMLLVPIKINDRHERAYHALEAQLRNEVITDVAIEEEWTWAFVGTVYCTKMRAKAAVPGPPAPTPAAPAAAPAPLPPAAPPSDAQSGAAPPAPAAPAQEWAPGVQATLLPNARIRTRALPDASEVPGSPAGSVVTLKATVRNRSGSWWYVSGASGAGWVRAEELGPAP